jgi:hypothetical protein
MLECNQKIENMVSVNLLSDNNAKKMKKHKHFKHGKGSR